MSISYQDNNSYINSEAYLLIHDPTRLLELLFSKYGDIEEDYNSIFINECMFNKSSHYLCLYKEHQYNDFFEEYLKRYYNRAESNDRLPKLSEYYKNYHMFFCRPIFRNFTLTDLMHTYGDNQAEVFYKNNYADAEPSSKTSNNNTDNDESLSSLDNITNNKTIFDKRTRFLIDTNNSNMKSTFTITLDSSRLNTNNVLYSKRSKNNSFINMISDIISPKVVNIKVNTNNTINANIINGMKNKVKTIRMKSSLCTLTKAKIEHFNSNTNFPINGNGGNNPNNKILLSPKLKPYLTTFKSNIAEFNKNQPRPNLSNNNYNSLHFKNKTYFYNGNNIKKISKLSTSIANTKNSIVIMTNMTNGSGMLNGGTKTTNIKRETISQNKKKKNKTFDIYSTSKSKGKKPANTSKYKSPISSKTITNTNSTNAKIHPSSSIPKYNHTSTKSAVSSKKIGNTSNCSYNIMLENLKNKKNKYIVQSQRAISSNIKSPTISTRKEKSSTNTNNECVFISRNKKNIHKNSIHSIRSIKGKNNHNCNGGNSIHHNAKTTITKSVDEKGKTKKEHNYQMSQRLINQIEELIKRAKFGYINNGKTKSKHPIEVNCGTTRGNSMKPINVNLNNNFRIKSSERKMNRMASP